MSRPSASAPPPSAPPLRVAASKPLPLAAPIVGRHLDRPALGPLDGDLLVAGWALCAEGPIARVLALAGDAAPLHVRADRERADIAELHPDVPHAAQCGFRLRVPAAAVQRLGELTIAAELPDGRRIPLWRVQLAPARPAGDAAPPAAPAPPRRRLGRKRAASTAPQPAAAQPATAAASAPQPPAGLAPTLLDDDFRVVALIAAYNEADIIEPVLDHLAAHGVWSYLIDNGSTDATVARAQRRLGRGLLGIERLADPDGGRTSWRALLARKRELAQELGADWYVHHDADEIRESPWPGMTLREAIRWVDRAGYNLVDFRVLNFIPVDDAFRPGMDPRTHFTRWEEPGEYDLMQRKCWKAGYADLDLAEGGHDVRFAERRIFPLRFLLRHYPIRGQAHGLRKVFEERKDRFTDAERAFGWHRQYDHVERPDHLFLRNPAALRPFDLDAIRLETLLHDAAAAAQEPSPPPPAPAARGFLDEVSPRVISGWAAREDGEPALVELWDGARLIATVTADEPRADLAEQGIADGRGGFTLPTPRELLDGRPHWIWATVAGGDAALRRSPLVLHAAGRVSLGAASEPAGDAVEVG